MRRLDMSKVKEILRLKFDAGLSLNILVRGNRSSGKTETECPEPAEPLSASLLA